MVQELDQVYACPGGIPLRYDYFRPDSDIPIPLVVCIHGGGWISGQKEDYRELALHLASNGFAAAVPQYRLAPLHPFPSAVEDILAFVTFARSEHAKLGVDPQRFASFGNSAGGHLAAMAGLSNYSDSKVQAVVDICGISDLTDPHGQHFSVSLGFLEQFMAHPYEGHEKLYRAASPLHRISEDPPPFLLIHGDMDDVVPAGQSQALSDALLEAGGRTELHILHGEGHSFSWEGWQTIERLYVDFLKKALDPAPL